MILASVVLPEPGGPQKMHEATSPRRISSPSALPGPSRFSWPRKPSRVRGRMRAASGPPPPWNSVGSDTGNEKRETRNVLHDRSPLLRESATLSWPVRWYPSLMKRLEKLDVWRGAQDLAHRAYLLTMTL